MHFAPSRLYVDGAGSAAVFNGPVPLEDTRFTSNNNYLAGEVGGERERVTMATPVV